MSLLDRMLGRNTNPPDPTVNWQESGGIELIVVPNEGKFGPLKFGVPIGDAEPLGKPSRFRWVQNDYCELLYAAYGFQIDFEANRLAYIAFYMDHHVAEPDIVGGYNKAVVSLRIADGSTVQLSKESTHAMIECNFGTPDLIDVDVDEKVLTYRFDKYTIEFEIHPERNSLTRMNIYPA